MVPERRIEVSFRGLRGFGAVSALLQFSQGLVHMTSIHLNKSEGEREKEGERGERRMGLMPDESRLVQKQK